MSLETLLARLEAESVPSVPSRKTSDGTELTINNQSRTVCTVCTVEKSVRPRQERRIEAANDPAQPITSWSWRIIHQDGSEVQAFFSPAVTRDDVLRLTPGAVNATTIDDHRTGTRVELAVDLRRMIQAMGEHWHYSDGDYATAYKGARSDPDQWRALCAEDSKRFGWQVPKALTPGELEQAVAEAVAERRAILEHEARLSAERADAVTKLATVFYRHVFGVAHETGCCKPRSGSYCVEGLRLRDEYYEVAS